MPVTSWTIAHRKPSANRIVRVGGLALTWDEARTLAAQLGHVRPDLQVYCVPTLAAEVAGYVVAEDRGNILMHTGTRVRMVDTGTLDAFPPLGGFHSGPGITVIYSDRPTTTATCICGWSADLSGPMSGHDEAAEDLYTRHLVAVTPVALIDARPVVSPLLVATHARVDFVETGTREWDGKPGPRPYVGCTCTYAHELDADTWEAERAAEARTAEHLAEVAHCS